MELLKKVAKDRLVVMVTHNPELADEYATRIIKLKDGRITDEGLASLEPYRAKRAVFIAAGFGSRLAPVTLDTPKPLVTVNGKRLIDGLSDAA